MASECKHECYQFLELLPQPLGDCIKCNMSVNESQCTGNDPTHVIIEYTPATDDDDDDDEFEFDDNNVPLVLPNAIHPQEFEMDGLFDDIDT